MIWDSLADNVIEELPASLCNLIQLKSLCLDNNQVKQVEQLRCDLLNHLYLFYCESLNIYGVISDSRWIVERLQESAKSFSP